MTPTLQGLLERKPMIEAAAKQFGASEVRIFGSVARGTAHDGSDVDVLVKMDRGRSLLDLIGFEQLLAEELGVRIDVVSENCLHPRLRSSARSDGIRPPIPKQFGH